jgi:hypothetical protein
MVSRVAPQSKQTTISGNIRTPGLTRCLRPLKWIIISVLNSASFADKQTRHAMAPPNHRWFHEMQPTLTVAPSFRDSFILAQWRTPGLLMILTVNG